MRATLGIFLGLSVAVLLRKPLESSMATHALVQLPLLVAAGYLLAPRAAEHRAHPMAVPALLIALFAAAIWMLPRMLDAALSTPEIELVKLFSLPLVVGLPLGWCWGQLSSLTRSFVWANLVSMLLILGWLYLAAPIRVCNFYVVSEQKTVGMLYLTFAAAIVAYWLPRVFLGGGPGRTAD